MIVFLIKLLYLSKFSKSFVPKSFVPKSFATKKMILLPGYGCSKDDYLEFKDSCLKRNIQLDIVDIKRHDWLRLFKSAVTKEYWDYDCNPYITYDWYLDKTLETVEKSFIENNMNPITLCGHSAGGWLGRAFIGDNNIYGTKIKSSKYVSKLITMGTPNIPPNNKYMDITHGCLNYVNNNFPGAYIDDIDYITLGSSVKKINTNKILSWKEYIVSNSYINMVGSKNNIINGDGIVPIESVHLDGAKQITFENVYHFKSNNKKWYGDESVIDSWLYM